MKAFGQDGELTEEFLDLLRETPVEKEIRRERAVRGEWIYWIEGEWGLFETEAERRDRISDSVSWTRRWSENFNLVGSVGEGHYGFMTDQERTAGFGDDGQDFPGVDAKGTPRIDDPRLYRHVDDPLKANFYALVAVDLRPHRSRYVGYASREELLAAELVDYGYGPTRTIFARQLHEGIPPA